jgi:FkbM family methyltransferase
MAFFGITKRAYNNLNKRIVRWALPRLVTFRDSIPTVTLGSGDGAWEVPTKSLSNNPLCYCFGVGLDISFDVALAERGAQVYAFDPTPRSIEFMTQSSYDRNKIHFYAIGVWERNATLRFYAPMSKSKVNFSTKDIHATGEFFIANCKTLKSIMEERGHEHLDILKLDIEGSWFEVLRNIVNDKIDVGVICVEFDTPVNLIKAAKTIRMLDKAGFELISRRRDNFLFLRNAPVGRPEELVRQLTN